MQTKVLPLSLKASGWFLSGLGKPFPGLTAQLFLRLYSTPPKRKLSEKQLEVKSKAVEGRMSVSKYSFDEELLTIKTYRWGEGGRKVLLVHGWADTALSYGALIESLVLSGYEVIAYDAPAHGQSEGKRTNFVQFMHVLDQFIRQEKHIHAIIGHSVGGLNAALTITRKAYNIPAMVLVSPALSAPDFFGETFDIFRIRPNVRTRTYALIKANLKEDLQSIDLRLHIGRIPAGKILLAYDEQDQLIKHTDIDSFIHQYPSILPYKVNGGGHFRIMKNPAVIGKIVGFLGTT
jgi:pimeloyl-ACP methyl ester carboxylesterase